MKKKILIDVTISCDPPSQRYYRTRTMEEIAESYEDWVKEFDAFIRDHRSQDPVSLSVERKYQDVCSFCGYEWDEDTDGRPCCCDKAIAEYEEERRGKNEANLHQLTAASCHASHGETEVSA